MAVWRWQRRPAYRLLLLWLAVLLVPAMLALDVGLGPNTLRMIGAAPAVYLLIGVGMWETFRLLKDQWGLIRIFRGDGSRAAIVLGAVIIGGILIQGVITYRTYFQEWAVTPAFYLAYHGEWTDAAHELNAQPAAAEMVYLLPYRFDKPYGFEYLYHGAAPAHAFRVRRPDLAHKVESTLAAMGDITTVKVLGWNENFVWAGEEDENLVALLAKFGSYVGSEDFTNFRLHTYTDIDMDRRWTFYDQLEPLTVHYDGGISLHGFALGQGVEQLALQQSFNQGEKGALWVALQWQTSPVLEIDYSISLRLLDARGVGVYQKDNVLRNEQSTPTSFWSPENVVDTIFYLDIPSNLAPGEYELRLVVYDFESLKPTVELGVWEPGLVLARLRLGEVQ